MEYKNPKVTVVFVLFLAIAAGFLIFTCSPSAKFIRPGDSNLAELLDFFDQTTVYSDAELGILGQKVDRVIAIENYHSMDLIADVMFAYPRYKAEDAERVCLAQILVHLGATDAVKLFEKDPALPSDLSAEYASAIREVNVVSEALDKAEEGGMAASAVELAKGGIKSNAAKRHVIIRLAMLEEQALPAIKAALADGAFPDRELLKAALKRMKTAGAKELLISLE